MPASAKYHVTLGKKRTTVTLDIIVSNLMAIKLKTVPDSAKAHTAVREWLQALLDEDPDPGKIHVSQWLTEKAVLFLVNQSLEDKYWGWRLGEF